MNQPTLSGEVEADEVYITAGFKGNNNSLSKDRPPRFRGLKRRGRGTYDTDKVPVFGVVQRNGDVVFEVVKNVKTKTIKPIIQNTIQKNTTVYTDEYKIYNFLDRMDYQRTIQN